MGEGWRRLSLFGLYISLKLIGMPVVGLKCSNRLPCGIQEGTSLRKYAGKRVKIEEIFAFYLCFIFLSHIFDANSDLDIVR